MCGITGAAWIGDAPPLERPTLERMTDLLRHRGPDDRGFYFGHRNAPATGGRAAHVALGMRRLSIIDRAGGHQPMSNEDGSVWVVFNGEIYNYRELRRRLEGAGHRFQTQSDTETLVHLYEDEGVDFLAHLNGMFALALWDERRGQLLLARDRLGQKPLVYRHEEGRLLFASEMKSLLEVPGVSRELDPHALDLYLTYQYVPHPHTIFRGICKLPPAHYALFCNGRLTTECYWQCDFNQQHTRPQAECVDELREQLRSAVRLRLQSDVPLGAFLSGGVDSSIIVALMQELSEEPVRTFSIGFSVAEYDETRYARQVAECLGTQHREFRVEPKAIEILPKLVWHYDEPFADSSAVPTYYVSKLTREHVTVALSGDGGDELFVGYPRYAAVRIGAWFDALPSPMRRVLGSPWWQRLPSSARQKSVLRRFKRLSSALGECPERRYLDWISIFNESQRASLYSDEFLSALPDADPVEFLRAALKRSGSRDRVTATALADLVTYLPCDLMTKVDIASMAVGLECRQPFLDYRLVELAAAMPLRIKVGAFRGKKILRQAFGDLLPPAIGRRRKMGFGVPLDHWFRDELKDYVREVLLDPSAAGQRYFRPEAVRRLIDEHQSGQFDHSHRLWSLLFFELWHRQWAA